MEVDSGDEGSVPRLSFDIWNLILTHALQRQDHYFLVDPDQPDIANLQLVCFDFCAILRPLMYRHVNLCTLPAAKIFFATVVKNEHLAEAVHTLQLSFDTDPSGVVCSDGDSEGSRSSEHSMTAIESEVWSTFWTSFRAALGKLIRLDVLSFSYEHSDLYFLQRLIEEGDLGRTLSSTVKRLHLKPIPDDYSLNMEDLLVVCAWDHTSWRAQISRIPHISQLLLTTPCYVVWPPTDEALQICMSEWTSQFRHPECCSQLKEIIVNSGFGDWGRHIEDFINEGGDMPAEVFLEERGVGGAIGTQVVWRRCVGKRWKLHEVSEPSNSNRQEYFFGRGHDGPEDYNIPWIYIDEEKHGKAWRKNERRQRIPEVFGCKDERWKKAWTHVPTRPAPLDRGR
ncbi:hypothetical protein DFH07DRAFT_969014 [Mycena maculata]|uniref:Uncharacterized protein n=1 Tax=Mycena maculata TaxID=230809 RepID=A0AAD7MS83_9AGAR|nr:hypothetical protein DFH07DRAFT_969014 [Mycena maculata]